MARLGSLKPQLSTLRPQLGPLTLDERARDRQRHATHAWRGWYSLKRWRDLRRAVFVRDAYLCQRTGALCTGRHKDDPLSPVANHKRPHRGDPALFWDIDNIETVTKAVHDSVIQAEERQAAAADGVR